MRKIEEKNEEIEYTSKDMSLSIYRNLLKREVNLTLWIREKGSFHRLTPNQFYELFDLLKEVKVDDLEVK